jgi:hypothetical protein
MRVIRHHPLVKEESRLDISCGWDVKWGGWKSDGFVECLPYLQAVVELSDEFVEQVALGSAVPVAGGSSAVVVAPGTVAGSDRG